jgi:uncharacterized SAM-binding protein YcdF (DUF218 family)
MTYVQPLLLLFGLIALVGVMRLRRYRGSWVAMLGVGGLLVSSWPPIDWLLSRPLEMWYPVQPYQMQPAQAIVVLSSTVDPPHFERPYPLPDSETYSRCEFAAWLHTQRQPLPILACGGGTDSTLVLAVTMRELLRKAGIPDTMIWTEERSLNTHENAVYGAEILRKHGVDRVVLVVDAQSMPRAAACFRKVGIAVVPAPSRFREFGPVSQELLPSWRSIARNELTLHEVIGLAWYWLRGWV